MRKLFATLMCCGVLAAGCSRDASNRGNDQERRSGTTTGSGPGAPRGGGVHGPTGGGGGVATPGPAVPGAGDAAPPTGRTAGARGVSNEGTSGPGTSETLGNARDGTTPRGSGGQAVPR